MVKAGARRGEPPLPAATVVLRGDLLEPELMAESTMRNLDVYGFYGVAVFAETDAVPWIDLAASRFVQVPWLVLFTAGDLRTLGWNSGIPAKRPTTT